MTSVARNFARYIAVPAMIGGAALGLAGMASAATSGQARPAPATPTAPTPTPSPPPPPPPAGTTTTAPSTSPTSSAARPPNPPGPPVYPRGGPGVVSTLRRDLRLGRSHTRCTTRVQKWATDHGLRGDRFLLAQGEGRNRVGELLH
jgi:hypothetical protein